MISYSIKSIPGAIFILQEEGRTINFSNDIEGILKPLSERLNFKSNIIIYRNCEGVYSQISVDSDGSLLGYETPAKDFIMAKIAKIFISNAGGDNEFKW